jgi:hypothetical protein
VDESCPDAVPSSTFAGSDVAFYSYLSCGHTADCYTGMAWNEDAVWPTGCPYDPNGGKTYKVHKSGDCACQFHGQMLSADIYTSFPEDNPGAYASTTDFPYTRWYGTTCASWDQTSGTPWFQYCPAGSDWCDESYNWCQQPWCFVTEACATGKPTQTFEGSPLGFYSYDTCLSTPDCYSATLSTSTDPHPAACPFDFQDNSWHTATQCDGWTTEPTPKGGPTPAPGSTPAPTFQVITKVVLTMTVANVDYAQLMANTLMVASFKDQCATSIAASLTGIDADDVAITITAGSVNVRSEITPPSGVTADAFKATVASSFDEAAATSLASNIASNVPGIDGIKTGDIGVTGVATATAEITITATPTPAPVVTGTPAPAPVSDPTASDSEVEPDADSSGTVGLIPTSISYAVTAMLGVWAIFA